MTRSVSKRQSVWPPITTIATVRRVPAPAPVPSANGNMPATSAAVVIRIGRSRSSQPCRMASSRGKPSRRSDLMWSSCRMEFFFTMPKSTRMPTEL